MFSLQGAVIYTFIASRPLTRRVFSAEMVRVSRKEAVFDGLSTKHRRALPVLRYPRNMVIYHYPLIGVIFMVILLISIIQNYPNFFSKYYPKFTIWVIYPFIFNLGEF